MLLSLLINHYTIICITQFKVRIHGSTYMFTGFPISLLKENQWHFLFGYDNTFWSCPLQSQKGISTSQELLSQTPLLGVDSSYCSFQSLPVILMSSKYTKKTITPLEYESPWRKSGPFGFVSREYHGFTKSPKP